MSKGETLRALVNERLTAAAEEIFALVERTIAEYEEELCRSKEENQRKQQLLDQALAPPPVPQVPQINAQSSDVQIQTVIVKSEGDDTDDEESSERPAPCPQTVDTVTLIEVCTQEDPTVHQETPTEITAVINPSPQTANARSSVDLSNQDEMENTIKTSVGKRKRGRPRRVMAPTDAEEMHLQQPPKQPKEKGEEPKRIERRGAEAHPTRSTQETQLQIEIEGDATCKVDLDQTPVQSKCPKPKRSKPKRQKPKRQYRKGRLESLGQFISSKKTAKGMFRCSSCERVFTRLHHLERHVLIHTGEKAFTCSVCDKTFRLKQHLESHMAVHKDERRFGCPVCAKKFKRRDNLGRHIMVHSGLRPFACPECDVQFSLKKNLMRHMIVHNRDVTYCCSVCQMKFSSPFYYNKHMKTHL